MVFGARRVPPRRAGARNTFKEPAGGMWGILNEGDGDGDGDGEGDNVGDGDGDEAGGQQKGQGQGQQGQWR